jgi:hypothetical protein
MASEEPQFVAFRGIYPLFLDTCTCDQATINKGKATFAKRPLLPNSGHCEEQSDVKATAIFIVLFFQIKEKLFKKWI